MNIAAPYLVYPSPALAPVGKEKIQNIQMTALSTYNAHPSWTQPYKSLLPQCCRNSAIEMMQPFGADTQRYPK